MSVPSDTKLVSAIFVAEARLQALEDRNPATNERFAQL
jgi:hypothetical protein